MSAVPLTDWRPVARGGEVRLRRCTADDLPVPLPAHVGLWLDRMLGLDSGLADKEKPARQALYAAAIRALAPALSSPAVNAYRPLFSRWRAGLNQDDGVQTLVRELTSTSRVLLHPSSNQSVTDGSILLHHTYGVPYLPGSALKGLLRRDMEHHGDEGESLARDLLGADKDADPGVALTQGYLDILDALWIPEAPKGAPRDWSPLALDIVNPHHTGYYTGDAGDRPPPADHDAPIPTHRLSLAPGTRFLLAVQWADDPAHGDALRAMIVKLIDDVLCAALQHIGLGAWTSTGYGRFELEPGPRQDVASTPVQVTEDWRQASVTRNPATGELVATLADGKRAVARGQLAADLLSALLPDVVERIRGRKAASLLARVEPEGLNLRLAGLRPRSE